MWRPHDVNDAKCQGLGEETSTYVYHVYYVYCHHSVWSVGMQEISHYSKICMLSLRAPSRPSVIWARWSSDTRNCLAVDLVAAFQAPRKPGQQWRHKPGGHHLHPQKNHMRMWTSWKSIGTSMNQYLVLTLSENIWKPCVNFMGVVIVALFSIIFQYFSTYIITICSRLDIPIASIYMHLPSWTNHPL